MAEDSKVSRWTRHLDGWQAGLLVLLIAGAAVLVVTPRAVEPLDFPVVVASTGAIERAFEQDRVLAGGVVQRPLDVDVRHLGREMRSYNLAAAKGDLDLLAEARARLARAAVKAKAVAGAREIKRLRAVQTMRFIEELRLWQKTGRLSKELRALGGDVIAMLQRNRWCRGSRELVLDNPTLRVMYQLRWTQLSTLRDAELRPSADEQRHRYLFLLRHPFSSDGSNLATAAMQARAERKAVKRRLATIAKIVERMPSYPAAIAIGVTYYRAGMWAASVAALNEYLAANPDGPYRLRAQNHLKAALDRVGRAAH